MRWLLIFFSIRRLQQCHNYITAQRMFNWLRQNQITISWQIHLHTFNESFVKYVQRQRQPLRVINKKASIRWQDSAPRIFYYMNVSMLLIQPPGCHNPINVMCYVTGQPVSRTQASDAMTSWLPRYEVKCVQCRCFQCGSVPLRSDIKGTELPPANILIPLERQLIALQLCRWQFLYNELCSRLFVLYCWSCPKDDKFRYFIPILRKLGAA